jgi:hypothetical protein
VFLLVNVIKWKWLHLDGVEWHVVHAKFHKNRTSISNSALQEAIIPVACGFCSAGCKQMKLKKYVHRKSVQLIFDMFIDTCLSGYILNVVTTMWVFSDADVGTYGLSRWAT